MPDPMTGMMGLSAASSLIGAFGAKEASNKQADAARYATENTNANMIRALSLARENSERAVGSVDSAVGASRADISGGTHAAVGGFAPYMATGASFLEPLKQILTGGPDAQRVLESLPGFQFMQTQGQKGVTNQATSRGLSGNALREGASFATGLSKSYWSDLVGSLFKGVGIGQDATAKVGDITMKGAGMMADASMMGAGKIADVLASLGRTGADVLGSGSRTMAESITGMGNAQAAGTLGAAGQAQGGLNNITNFMMLDKLTGGKLFGATAPGGGGGVTGAIPFLNNPFNPQAA